KIALLPLLILWLGLGESSKVAVIALGVFFPMAINTYTGVRQADPLLVRAAVSFGARRWSVIRKVILPSALPMIFAGLRLGAGTARAGARAAAERGDRSALSRRALRRGDPARARSRRAPRSGARPGSSRRRTEPQQPRPAAPRDGRLRRGTAARRTRAADQR